MADAEGAGAAPIDRAPAAIATAAVPPPAVSARNCRRATAGLAGSSAGGTSSGVRSHRASSAHDARRVPHASATATPSTSSVGTSATRGCTTEARTPTAATTATIVAALPRSWRPRRPTTAPITRVTTTVPAASTALSEVPNIEIAQSSTAGGTTGTTSAPTAVTSDGTPSISWAASSTRARPSATATAPAIAAGRRMLDLPSPRRRTTVRDVTLPADAGAQPTAARARRPRRRPGAHPRPPPGGGPVATRARP